MYTTCVVRIFVPVRIIMHLRYSFIQPSLLLLLYNGVHILMQDGNKRTKCHVYVRLPYILIST